MTSIHPCQDEVEGVLSGMFAAYLRGDSAGIDSCLHPDVTIFDSAHAPLVSGFAELALLRQSRGSGMPSPIMETGLTVTRLVVRSAAEALIASFWLRVDMADADGNQLEPELSRNTAVFVRENEALRIVCLHEDVWVGPPPSFMGDV